mmetsp:Transcript_31157/g.78939  ORF Transcript_31157/g.78939 Transcript_31157/m.78939 type:complete len:203 (-) Transcript_31157:31-639(-)
MRQQVVVPWLHTVVVAEHLIQTEAGTRQQDVAPSRREGRDAVRQGLRAAQRHKDVAGLQRRPSVHRECLGDGGARRAAALAGLVAIRHSASDRRHHSPHHDVPRTQVRVGRGVALGQRNEPLPGVLLARDLVHDLADGVQDAGGPLADPHIPRASALGAVGARAVLPGLGCRSCRRGACARTLPGGCSLFRGLIHTRHAGQS